MRAARVWRCRGHARHGLGIVGRIPLIEACRGAAGVDVALHEHRAQPRHQTAPAVIPREEGRPLAPSVRHTVQLGVNRIREFPVRVSRDTAGRGIERGAALEHDVVPGCPVTCPARARQGEIGHMQRLQVRRDVRRAGAVREAVQGAAVEGLCKRLIVQRPSRRAALPVQALEQRAVRAAKRQEVQRRHGAFP